MFRQLRVATRLRSEERRPAAGRVEAPFRAVISQLSAELSRGPALLVVGRRPGPGAAEAPFLSCTIWAPRAALKLPIMS